MEAKFIQAREGAERKHSCPDCHFCQFCSETRCRACRSTTPCGKKLSISEQLALNDRVNQDDPVDPGLPLHLDL